MKHLRILLAAGVLACAPLAALATTTTGTLTVSATVNPSCTVGSSNALNFGSIIPSVGDLGSGSISFNCSSGAPYTVALDGGQNYTNARYMKGTITGTLLAYMLYQDAGHATSWGNGIFNGNLLDATGTGAAQMVGVFGETGGQSVPADTYSDIVTITVTF